jgi:hypothetical protein
VTVHLLALTWPFVTCPPSLFDLKSLSATSDTRVIESQNHNRRSS